MIDLSKLKIKLADQALAGLNDSAIMTALNTKNIASKAPVIVKDIERYLASTRKYIPIIDSTDINAREAVLALSKFDSFDTTIPIYLATLTQILDGLITAGLLTNTDKLYILGMADTLVSWSSQSIGRDITLTDIANARSYS